MHMNVAAGSSADDPDTIRYALARWDRTARLCAIRLTEGVPAVGSSGVADPAALTAPGARHCRQVLELSGPGGGGPEGLSRMACPTTFRMFYQQLSVLLRVLLFVF
jgi:hypothetical protein